MTVTLDLNPETEQGLLAQARARGVSLDDYLQEIVTRQARSSALAEASDDEAPDLSGVHFGAKDAFHRRDMAALDWSQCPIVESVPGRLSGAWVFRDTRMPVSAVFENLEAGASIEDIIEQFDISREQINAVLEFAARSLEASVPVHAGKGSRLDAHSF